MFASDDDDSDDDDSEDYSLLTYGSAVRFQHVRSRYYLHSHGINYGSGSGQQSVTAVSQDDDSNSLWQIKEAYQSSPIALGTPVKCQDTIRLVSLIDRPQHTRPATTRTFLDSFILALCLCCICVIYPATCWHSSLFAFSSAYISSI